jgi:hypothetical protein
MASASRVSSLLALAIGVGLTACPRRPDGGEGTGGNLWRDVLAQCAGGNQVGKVLFLTTSNNIGPGSIWRQSALGGYQPVRLFPDSVPEADGVINRGTPSTCNGSSVSTNKVSADVGIDKIASFADATLAANFRRAKTVTVGVGSWEWDEVMVGPFRDMIGKLDSASGYGRDIRTDTLIIGRAVRVNNLTASLEFDRTDADSLRVKLPLVLPGHVGVSWTGSDSTTLRITTSGSIYVAGEIYRWIKTNFASGDKYKVDLEPNAKVVPNPALR